HRMRCGICPWQIEVSLERGWKVVAGDAVDDEKLGRPWRETSRTREDSENDLPDLQHLRHHLRWNFAGNDAHLGVQRILHVVGVEARAGVLWLAHLNST